MNKLSETTTFDINGDNIAIGVPFEKINTKNRTIEGFATLDNIDKTGEIVDFEASREAFKSWLGNIREMHGPRAVGKALHFEEKEKEQNGRKNNGIYVKAYISKGAQDTWEKILDGTLKGFSIGGRVLEKRPEIIKQDDGTFSRQHAMRITKYQLAELSVVDNPANPLALFEDDVQKADLIKYDGNELEPTDIIVEERKVFYCEGCDVAKLQSYEITSTDCVTCEKSMDFVATSIEVPTSDELKKMVMDKYSNKEVNVSIPVGAKSELEKVQNLVEEAENIVKEYKKEEDLLNNALDDTTIVEILRGLIGRIYEKMTKTQETEEAHEASSSSQEGGESNSMELANILDVLKNAVAQVEEVLKAAGVVRLNSEEGKDVTVADQVANKGTEGSENVKPQVEGTSTDAADTWAAPPGDANVLPKEPVTKAEETSETTEEPAKEEVVAKSETPEETPAENTADLLKSVLSEELGKVTSTLSEDFAKKIEEVAARVEKIENSGAAKKSGEVNATEEIKKSDNGSLWGGIFYNGEITR